MMEGQEKRLGEVARRSQEKLRKGRQGRRNKERSQAVSSETGKELKAKKLEDGKEERKTRNRFVEEHSRD